MLRNEDSTEFYFLQQILALLLVLPLKLQLVSGEKKLNSTLGFAVANRGNAVKKIDHE